MQRKLIEQIGKTLVNTEISKHGDQWIFTFHDDTYSIITTESVTFEPTDSSYLHDEDEYFESSFDIEQLKNACVITEEQAIELEKEKLKKT